MFKPSLGKRQTINKEQKLLERIKTHIITQVFKDSEARFSGTWRRTTLNQESHPVKLWNKDFLCFFFKVFILKNRVTERKRQRQRVFHLMVYSPNDYSCLGWARPKSGASSRNPHVDAGTQRTGAIFCCLPSCFSRELDKKVEDLGLQVGRNGMLTWSTTQHCPPKFFLCKSSKSLSFSPQYLGGKNCLELFLSIRNNIRRWLNVFPKEVKEVTYFFSNDKLSVLWNFTLPCRVHSSITGSASEFCILPIRFTCSS